jgi:hypothetical protein
MMSAAEPQPLEPPFVQVEPHYPVERRRSAKLGVIAFILAILVFLFERAGTALVNTEAFIDQASPISGNLFGIQIFAALGVIALAVVAALDRRGTGWAFAAIAIVIAGNGLVQSSVAALFNSLFQAVFGTVVY